MSYKFSSSSSQTYNTGLSGDGLFDSDFTLAFWFKFPSGSRFASGVKAHTSSRTLGFWVDPGGSLLFAATTSGSIIETLFRSTYKFDDGKWHSTSIRRIGSKLIVDLDGRRFPSVPVDWGKPGDSTATSGSTLQFGTFSPITDSSEAYLAGIGFWDVGLADSQVDNLASGEQPFDDGSTNPFYGGTYNFDASENGLTDLSIYFPLQATPETEIYPTSTLNTSGTGIVVAANDPAWIHQIGAGGSVKNRVLGDLLNIKQTLAAAGGNGGGSISDPHVSDVDPSGIISGSYPTLQDWWDDVKNSTNPAQWVRCHKGDIGVADISGGTLTPTAAAYPRIFAVDKHDGTLGDDGFGTLDLTKVSAIDSSGSDVGLNISKPYVRVEGITVYFGGSNAGIKVTSSDTIINGCLVYLIGAGRGIQYDLPAGTNNLYCWNNIVASESDFSDMTGLRINSDDSVSPCVVQGEIYNNTFDLARWGSSTAIDGSVQSGHGGGFDNLKIKNNIVAKISFYYSSGQQPIISRNLWLTRPEWPASPPLDWSSSTGDDSPLEYIGEMDGIIQIPRRDWNLCFHSPALKRGLDLSSSFTTDAIDENRSTPWDIGALASSYDTAGQVYIENLDDSLDVTEDSGSQTALGEIQLTNSITIIDSATTTGSTHLYVSDSLTITDSNSSQAPIYITIHDAVTLAEMDDSNELAAACSDFILIKESLNESMKIGAANDSINIIERENVFSNHQYFKDILSLHDSVYENIKLESLSDFLLITDQYYQGGAKYPFSAPDNLVINEVIKTNQVVFNAKDVLTINESVDEWDAWQKIDDFVTIQDTASSHYGIYNGKLSDALVITDRGQGISLHLFDSLTINDEAHRVFISSFSDLLVTEEFIGFPCNIEDHNLNIEETLIGINSKPASDSLKILQILCTQLNLNIALTDALTFRDSSSGYIPDTHANDNNQGGTGTNTTPGFNVKYKRTLISTLNIQERVGVQGGLPVGCVISE